MKFILHNSLIAAAATILLLPSASALDWNKSNIQASAAEFGQLSDVAVDAAGRVHSISVSDNGTGTLITYQRRANATAGFIAPSGFRSLVDATTSGNDPRDVSIDVTNDFIVQASMVDENGMVRVYELSPSASGWSESIVASDAWGNSSTGVSLRSRGNGFSSSSLVFTRGAGASSNGVAITTQSSSGSWGTPVTIFSGTQSGQAPVLINVEANARAFRTQRIVASYNEGTNRVEATREQDIRGVFEWQPRRPIGTVSAPSFTRIGGDASMGDAGVSFVSSNNDSASQDGVYFARLSPGDVDNWIVSKATTSNEADREELEFYSSRCAMTFDAAGNPWVAYLRSGFPLFGVVSIDLRTRRFTPNLGWKLSVIEDLPGGLNQTTGSFALASGENGDPALVYERDNGDRSDFVFARPAAAPWVTEIPDDLTDVRQSFAPALASNPDGSFHLVTSHSTGGGFGFPAPAFRYTPRKLVTFSGGETTEVEIPSSSTPYVANAVASTSDGVVHIISLRLDSTSSAAGNIIYSRGPATGPIENAPSGQAIVADGLLQVAPGEISLESDAAGNLFAAYFRVSGGIEVRKLSPGSSEWEDVTSLSRSSISDFDLAVRSDGAVGLSYYDPARTGAGLNGAQIRYYSDASPINGSRSNRFNDYQAFFLSSGDGTPKNTACIFHSDGKPRIAFGLRGPITYLRPGTLSVSPFVATEPATGFIDATVEMVSRGSDIHILAHTSSEDGTLRHLQFQDSAPRTVVANDSFAIPGLGISSLGRTSLAATVDANGAPVMATGLYTGIPGGFATLLDIDTVIVSRPADALDHDGDGIPLLQEGAHCLDIFAKDPLTSLPSGRVRRNASGSVNLGFSYRAPEISSSSGNGGSQFGEFTYRYEAGSDLTGWAPEMIVSGSVDSLLSIIFPVTGEPGCATTSTFFQYSSTYIEANPRRFSRLRVVRDR